MNREEKLKANHKIKIAKCKQNFELDVKMLSNKKVLYIYTATKKSGSPNK